MQHLSWIGAQPHPIGAAATAKGRGESLVKREQDGLPVSVQRGQAATEYGSGDRLGARAANVVNVVAVLPGRDPGLPAVPLMTHYYTVPCPRSPGGADDGLAWR
ncbi:MAG: hypothetical protein K0M59_01125 [Stenotrophomonas sp.]|jgi:hypothetical protein|nr:hypothetical protein [Stenotrophomonas sp.]